MTALGTRLRALLKPRLLWDLFMVWAALINLYLIGFDLTYFWLRPTYLRVVPVVTRIYDPVKGVEPQPLTSDLLDQIRSTRQLVAQTPPPGVVRKRAEELRTLTRRVIADNPFARSGQNHSYRLLVSQVARAGGLPSAALRNPADLDRAVRAFWPGSLSALRHRLATLDPHIEQALASNYYREYDRSGHLTDHFWIIDLPFLVLFWIEFAVRWILALRRHTYARWFFFPIFNWYDLLGLVPAWYFRVFRLLRVVSIYMRLRRSVYSTVGQDVVSRAVAYVSNIITEEVSDRVALRILGELEEEIAAGTHIRIARSTFEPRRGEIERVVVNQIRQMLTDDNTMEHLRSLLRLNLETAVAQAEALRSVPLPAAIVKPVVRFTGEVILDTTLETVAATLDSEAGRQAVDELAAAVLDDLFYGPGLVEIEVVAKEIALGVLARMKEVVAIKKWARPSPDPMDVMGGAEHPDPTASTSADDLGASDDRGPTDAAPPTPPDHEDAADDEEP